MRRLLVVDDESQYCDRLSEVLSRAGHDVRVAHSGREAIDIGARFRPDILIADWMLKNHVNGVHVANVLGAIIPGVQTIVMTGFPSEDLREQSGDLAAVDFLEKPFRFERVQAAIARAVAQMPADVRDHHQLAMLEVNDRGEILHANPAATKLLDQTRAGGGARSLAEFFGDENAPDLERAVPRWLQVSPLGRAPLVWMLRAGPRCPEKTRLVLLRRANEPCCLSEALVQMLLGGRTGGDPRWPFDERVLMIDDDKLVRSIVVRMFEGAGAACYAVATPLEGLRLLARDPGIGIVVHDFDFDLPRHCIAQSVQQIRACQPDAEIIGTSGFMRQADFTALGVEKYLQKPWRIEDLVNVLRGRLGRCPGCGTRIPLRHATDGESTQLWICTSCGMRCAGVLDEEAPSEVVTHVRLVDDGGA